MVMEVYIVSLQIYSFFAEVYKLSNGIREASGMLVIFFLISISISKYIWKISTNYIIKLLEDSCTLFYIWSTSKIFLKKIIVKYRKARI